jgi:outer membrane receptor for ferrienterochelin and colicin
LFLSFFVLFLQKRAAFSAAKGLNISNFLIFTKGAFFQNPLPLRRIKYLKGHFSFWDYVSPNLYFSMRKILLQLLSVAMCLFLAQTAFGQGATTAALSGVVRDTNGEALPGATVVAVHTPTGSQFGTVTTSSGNYTILNMNVGGPYTIEVRSVGFKTEKLDNIYLNLGQTLRLEFKLAEESVMTEEVVITATSGNDGRQTGAQTVIGERLLNALPTVSRDLSDFTRATPQARITENGGITIAGQNNRYNSIMIDGAVNNDVFGLSETGTNGGQANISPISLDAIEQVQVVVAPYDVRQGGFAGGGINAVTRSGTNTTSGSAYYLFRNQNLAGKTPTDNASVERQKLDEFTAQTLGFRLGGAIVKNKLFFFLNGEIQRDKTPQPFDFKDYVGASSLEDIQNLQSQLISRFKYDPGSFLDNPREVKSNKLFARLDWNLSDKHKLTLRHSYTQGEFFNRARSSRNAINFGNNNIYFPSVTNSSALELKSTLGSNKSNSLIIGFTRVVDDRDPLGGDFPRVRIIDGSGNIFFGSEEFSTANQLKQSTLTITDNFSIFKGKHTLTFGTHNEFYSTYNLFIRQNYGSYVFRSLSDFATYFDNDPSNDAPASDYNRTYSLVDNVTGDGSAAAAEFTGVQFGFYAQDEFAATNKLTLTFGVRLDVPIFSDPDENAGFNDSTLAKIKQFYPELGSRIRSGQLWKTPILISPRFGFNYDVKGDKSLQLRGGAGIFTSRIPLVWPGGAYNNNGLTLGSARSNGAIFRPDPFNQYTAQDFGQRVVLPSGQMDLFVDDFKLPQVLRASLAVDKKLPWGMIGTLEGIYTKTLNNIVYYNVNVKPTDRTLAGADNRPYYNRRDAIEPGYDRIIVADNTNKGYSYNLTAQIQKNFDRGFTASLAYTYGRSMVINDGTSSQNSSQWRYMENVRGKNNLDLTYSDFDLGSRVVGMLSYAKEYGKNFRTTVSLFYEGRSGQRFSYIYRGQLANDDTGSGSTEADLIYVPRDRSEINLIDITDRDGNVTKTADEQWNELNAFIEADDYLSSRRGKYAERNGSRLPFVNILDLRLLQDFYITTGSGQKHNLQISFDVFNFTNLMNKKWGRRYFLANDNFALINLVRVGSDNVPQFQYTNPSSPKNIFTIDDSGVNSSRWQAQIGVRYTF